MRIYVFVLFSAWLFSACSKRGDAAHVKVIGHAGLGLENVNSLYAENSQEAMDLASSIDGCEGVEIDLQLSADGELWMYHDAFLDERTNAKGCISEKNANDLQAVSYSSFHSEKLVRLRDFQLPPNSSDLYYFLDLKHLNHCSKQAVDAQLVELELEKFYARLGDNSKVFVISSKLSWMLSMDISKHQFLYEVEDVAVFWDNLSLLDFSGISIRNSKISAEELAKIQAASKKVAIFDIRAPKPIREALRKKPDFLITDDIRSSLIEKHR
jgi:glycerophosphoryl diester phosphodiesterase